MQRLLAACCHISMRIPVTILIVAVLTLITSCKKDELASCEELKEAAFPNQITEVKSMIEAYIRRLPSKNYNEKNIQLLTQQISKCDLSSSIYCFDCIKTLPSQTEISLDFIYNGTPVHKMIDLSYTADKKIVFRNLHD